MSKVPYGKYSKELREEAVRLMTEEGLTVSSASKTHDIPKSTLENWLRLHKQGKLGFVGQGKKPLTEVFMTYIRTAEGWLYLCSHQDAYNGESVGYAMAQSMSRNLVLQSLLKAYALHRPSPGLIHHSDRGSKYCAGEVRERLNSLGKKQSMS